MFAKLILNANLIKNFIITSTSLLCYDLYLAVASVSNWVEIYDPYIKNAIKAPIYVPEPPISPLYMA
jgi:hypothetical protein